MREDDSRQRVAQNIVAVDGVAYGVIGADIHLFRNSGIPLYRLANWRSLFQFNETLLTSLPDQTLNARFEVADFIGRADELKHLCEWRDTPPRLGLRWMHGPDGQGKTWLAEQLQILNGQG